MSYTVAQKRELSDLLAKGHERHGRVLPRRPYRDDDEGGAGRLGIDFETHPLFANLPDGADSDLTAVITNNAHTDEEAQERTNDLDPQLRKQLEQKLEAKLQKSHHSTPRPSPLGGG